MTEDQKYEWREVGDGTPLHVWLETKREGEDGSSECFARIIEVGGQVEWIDRQGYTTVTHSTFLPPTHWRFRVNPFEELLKKFDNNIDYDFSMYLLTIPSFDMNGNPAQVYNVIYDALKIASEQFKRK